MIAVIVSICLGTGACKDVLVTSSDQDPSLTMTYCMAIAPAAIADWMAKNRPGYRVAGWKCVFGKRAGSA